MQRLLQCVAVITLALGASRAMATIPDANGVYNACYNGGDGSLRLIDPQVTQTCPRNWKGPVQWNDTASFNALLASINAEVARAKGVEALLSGQIFSEIAQRVAADETLGASVQGEIARAKGAEAALATSQAAETERAMAKEQWLASGLEAEARSRGSADDAMLVSATGYTSSRVNAEASARTQGDADTLAAAKGYADARRGLDTYCGKGGWEPGHSTAQPGGTTTGANGGYEGMDLICRQVCDDNSAHMCSGEELLRSLRLGLLPSNPNCTICRDNFGWYAATNPGVFETHTDPTDENTINRDYKWSCRWWTDGTGESVQQGTKKYVDRFLGPLFGLNTFSAASPYWYFVDIRCDYPYGVWCCKP